MGIRLYVKLFSLRSYRFLLVGRLFSLMGIGVLQLAVIWDVMSYTHNNPLAVSGVVLIQALPFVLLGLYAGIKTDRWNAKTVMMYTEGGRVLIWVIIGILSVTDRLSIPVLLSAVFLDGLCGAFFSPAFRTITPRIVTGDLLQPANALLNVARDGTMIVGPAILALLLALLHSERDIFLFTASTYFVSVICIFLMSYLDNNQKHIRKAASWLDLLHKDLADMATTIRIIKDSGPIFGTMMANIISIVCNTVGWEVALPLLVKSNLGLTIVNYGEVVGALSFGSLIFGFLLGMVPIRRRLLATFVGILLWGIGLATIGFGHNLTFAIGGAILMALGQALQGLNIIVLLQQKYSEHVGSVFSGYHGLQYAGNVVGSMMAGPILAMLPASFVITFAGTLIVLIGLGGWVNSISAAGNFSKNS